MKINEINEMYYFTVTADEQVYQKGLPIDPGSSV